MYKLIIIDDEEKIASGMAQLFPWQNIGFEVVQVFTGARKALQYIAENPVDVALRTICMMEIWQFGSSMVMFLAALKNVPADLYEAAEIDGASKVKMFFSITVPQITPIIFFNLIMQTIQALQNFTSAFVITDGGPMKATYVLGMKLYKEGFSYFKMGYASAISWIIFIVIMLITLVLFATSKRWVFYGDES